MSGLVRRSLYSVCSLVRNSLTTTGRLPTVAAIHSGTPLAGRWEPDDIKYEPDIPEYPTLNIQMKAYDFIVLESFSKYVHNLTQNLDLNSVAFASPAQTKNIKTYKPFSTNIQNEYSLALYERNVQIKDTPNTLVPLLMEAVRLNTPEGVDVTVKEVDKDEDDFRYVPDLVLRELKNQLQDIEQAREDRKKK